MAASMARNVTEISVQYRHHILFNQLRIREQKRALSTLSNEQTQPKVKDRTNWFLDTEVTSHRRHAGIHQVKPVRLPDNLLSNIKTVLEGQTIRNLQSEAKSLYNYLHSRKRPVEDSELRAAARHFSQEFGLEDLDSDEIKNPLLAPDTQRKLRHVMAKLRKSLYRWKPIEYDDKSLAYMLSRMAPNYAVLYRILNEIRQQDPGFEPRSILDFGSGVGTSVWAAHSLWQDAVKEYYLVDVSKPMHQLAERLLQVDPKKGILHIPNVYHRFFMPVSLRSRYDMTVSAYSLLDLPSLNDRISAVQNLWKITNNYLVLVENGSYESYLALMEVRDSILQENRDDLADDGETSREGSKPQIQDRLMPQTGIKGGHVFAPCPHDQTCPRLTDESGTPCNFEQSYHPLPQYVGLKGDSPSSERFSYVVLKKGARDTSQETTHWPRVVRPVIRRSRHVICRLCRQDGSLGEAVITKSKHSKDLYRCARYTSWGDHLPAIQTNRQTDTDTPR